MPTFKQFITEDNYYNDKCIVFHTTTYNNLQKIKKSGKLIPTDHIYFNKLYKNRLHLSTDKISHIRMIKSIADDKIGFDLKNLYTLIIKVPCFVPDNSDGFDIEYQDLKIDNNAGYDGRNFYINKPISIKDVIKIIPFNSFISSREY